MAPLGNDLHENVGYDCIEFGESRNEPQAGKIRIDGNGQSLRILLAAQLGDRTLHVEKAVVTARSRLSPSSFNTILR